jgi:hypothetical protein
MMQLHTNKNVRNGHTAVGHHHFEQHGAPTQQERTIRIGSGIAITHAVSKHINLLSNPTAQINKDIYILQNHSTKCK